MSVEDAHISIWRDFRLEGQSIVFDAFYAHVSQPNAYAQQTSYRDDDDDLEEGDPNSEFEMQQQEVSLTFR